MTYELFHNFNDGTTGIKCLLCEKTSHNPNDNANRYCGNCKYYHSADENKNEQVYKDLFGNVVIYDMKEANEAVWEMHNNVKAKKWLILRIDLDTNQFIVDFMLAWAKKFDKSMLVHETGNNGVMFISQEPESIDVEKFKHYFGIAKILS